MAFFSTKYFAHRGLHGDRSTVPENSLRAFSLAAEKGYGIELDIQRTKDDRIVVFHDTTLTRVCGADKRVADLTYDELQEYYLYTSDQKIPLFSEVLRLVAGRVPLLIEFKSNWADRLLCQKAAIMLDCYNGQYCIESFNPFVLVWFRIHRPLVMRGQLATDFVARRKNEPLFSCIIMQPLLSNIFTKPNFISLDYRCRNWLLFKFMLRNRLAFGWTFRSPAAISAYEDKYDCFIFEKKRSS